MADDEHIRKVVGQKRETERPLQRMYVLWQRLVALGIDQPNKNERIRKVVGRSGEGER